MVDEDGREEAAAARGRTVLTKMPLEREKERGGGEAAAMVGCEVHTTAAAPSAPIESFMVVGPIGPSLYRCPQYGAV